MTRASNHDICGLQITVNHPILVEIEQAVEQLEQDGLDHLSRNRPSGGLRVVVNDLEQVVLAIFEDHEDTFVFENNLSKVHKIGMRQLGA